MKRIFLITGKAQHGKDTTAGFIKETLEKDGKRVLIVHYADLLKFIAKSYLGWDGNKDEKGRKLLQYVGTDVIRKQEPDLWVDFVAKMIKFFKNDYDYVIVPDTRFPNEVTKMKLYFDNVTLIRVIRPNFKSPLTPEQQAHPSETALDDYPAKIVVENSGTLEDLENDIVSSKYLFM